jgi:hypothetical protein
MLRTETLVIDRAWSDSKCFEQVVFFSEGMAKVLPLLFTFFRYEMHTVFI